MEKIKFSFAILIISIATSESIAQSYNKLLNSNFKWELFQADQISICGYFDGQLLFENNDTVISGLTYKCIYSSPIKSNSASGFFCPPYEIVDSISALRSILREDTIFRKVFIYDTNNNLEHLLYDFNANDSDTLFNYFGTNGITVTIDSVRLVNYPIIGLRKTYYVHLPGSAGDFNYLEGVGGINGVDVTGFEAIGNYTVLTCMRDSTNNNIFGNCNASLVGINDINLHQTDIFHYNNILHSFQLKCGGNNRIKSLTLYNLLGDIVYTNYNLTCNNDYSLFLSISGVYLYKLHFEENKNSYLTGKIVIIN